MSPYDFWYNTGGAARGYIIHSDVFIVYGSEDPGNLGSLDVIVACGVRPVISLENGNFIVIL